MIKTLSKLGIEENFFDLIDSTYKKKKKHPTANILLNEERLSTFPLI